MQGEDNENKKNVLPAFEQVSDFALGRTLIAYTIGINIFELLVFFRRDDGIMGMDELPDLCSRLRSTL